MIAQSIIGGLTQGGGFRCPAIFSRRHVSQPAQKAPRAKSLVRRRPEFEARVAHPLPSLPEFDDEASGPAAEKHTMRVLLRNTRTSKFLQFGERWTKNPKLARDFGSGWGATYHAFTMDTRDLAIEYEFEDERYNLHVPVLSQSNAR